MSRLSKEVVATREAFLVEEFKKQPELSVRAANELIIAKFGKQMRPKRILEIRRGLELIKLGVNDADEAVRSKTLGDAHHLLGEKTFVEAVQAPVVLVLDRPNDEATAV